MSACAQNVKKFSAFFRPLMFIAVFTGTHTHPWSLIHSTTFNCCVVRGIFRVMTPIIQVDSFLKNFKQIYLYSLYIPCRLHGPPIS